jgi:hypothetical protein
MNTVNVIEILNGSAITSLAAFEDNAEGNKKAESLFRICCKTHGVTENIATFIEDGYATSVNYSVFLVHSTN